MNTLLSVFYESEILTFHYCNKTTKLNAFRIVQRLNYAINQQQAGEAGYPLEQAQRIRFSW